MSIKTIPTPAIEGVTVRRHVLDHEAARMCGIAQRLGRRLSYWLKNHPVHELPDEAFLESFRVYGQVVSSLLKEQRERAKMTPKNGGHPVDEATFDAQMKELARATVLELPQGELDELLMLRRLDVTPGSKTGGSDDR